jgi:hypothetical protein
MAKIKTCTMYNNLKKVAEKLETMGIDSTKVQKRIEKQKPLVKLSNLGKRKRNYLTIFKYIISYF